MEPPQADSACGRVDSSNSARAPSEADFDGVRGLASV